MLEKLPFLLLFIDKINSNKRRFWDIKIKRMLIPVAQFFDT